MNFLLGSSVVLSRNGNPGHRELTKTGTVLLDCESVISQSKRDWKPISREALAENQRVVMYSFLSRPNKNFSSATKYCGIQYTG